MRNARRDRLVFTCAQIERDRSRCLHRELGAPSHYPKQAPRPVGDPVVTAQTRRQGRFVERPCSSCDDEARRELGPVAERAVEARADVFDASSLCLHPWPRHEGRAVSNVLPMMASELGYPVTDFVLSEARDLALHQPRQPGRWLRWRVSASGASPASRPSDSPGR